MVSDPMMNALASFRAGDPFRPFELIFRDGSNAVILWPDAVGWHVNGDQLSYAASDDSFVHRRFSELVDVRLLGSQGAREGGTAA